MPKNIDSIIRNPNPKPTKKSAPEATSVKKPKNNLLKYISQIRRHNKNKTKIVVLFLILFALCLAFLIIYTKPALYLYSFKKDGRYLILLQNNAELRGGGGFLGSFAVVEIANNSVKKYYFESNIYKKDNEFAKVSTYQLPDYLAKHIGGQLELRDANYAADFSDAAKNVAKFYQIEYGENVDGVVALNASAIADLLKITGPISNNAASITKENFFNELQTEIQQNYFQSDANRQLNEPKTVLKEMIDPLIGRVKKTSPLTLLKYYKRELSSKMITFWFNDARQTVVAKNNWGGEIYRGEYESLFISNTNVAGGKSSLTVGESIELTGESRESRIRTLAITRQNIGGLDYDANKLNRNYTRIYLPKGTKIEGVTVNEVQLSADEFDIKEEFSKTYVGFWLSAEPKQMVGAKIEYRLSKNISSQKIVIQKQPGVVSEKIKVRFGNVIVRDQQLFSDLII